jgi:hypothetical protein
MLPSIPRVLVALVAAVATVTVALGAGATSASADPTYPIHARVDATTHIAKSGQDVSVPPGMFDGSVDLASGSFGGNLSLPPATVTFKAVGLVPIAEATFEISQLGPTTGHVNFGSLTVTSTSTFNIKITRITPHGTNVNLVGSRCVTSKPITVTMSGAFSPTTPSTFTGVYTIPPFAHCQALTPALNQLIPGPGNTFSAIFTPQGASPPPPAGPAPRPGLTPAAAGATVSGGLNVTAGPRQVNVPTYADVQAPLPPVPAPMSSPPRGAGLVGVVITQ